MIITNRVTTKRSDNSENYMDNMHTQNAKLDMALEIRLQILALDMLAGSKLTSEEGSHARARAGKNKLANNGAGKLSTADALARLNAGQ